MIYHCGRNDPAPKQPLYYSFFLFQIADLGTGCISDFLLMHHIRHFFCLIAEKSVHFFAAHLKPILLDVLVGKASRRMAERKYSGGLLQEPPRSTRYLPISGPCGFEALSVV